MPKVRTHYDNLKVARDAPPEVIRAAYKSLSQKYHPDRNSSDPNASRTMAIINAAYRVLSNPDLRKRHDEWIRKIEAESADKAAAHASSPDLINRHPSGQAQNPVVGSAGLYKQIQDRQPLRRYGWVYLFLALVECLLLVIILFLQSN